MCEKARGINLACYYVSRITISVDKFTYEDNPR